MQFLLRPVENSPIMKSIDTAEWITYQTAGLVEEKILKFRVDLKEKRNIRHRDSELKLHATLFNNLSDNLCGHLKMDS